MASTKKHKTPGVITNRKARFEYEVNDTLEAGLVLSGPEVKSLRLGRASLTDAFVQVRQGQAFLINATINKYEFSRQEDYDPKRTRKLLLHKDQIYSLAQKLDGVNLTLVPLRIYTKRGRFKVLLGVAKGRQLHDKRERLKRRDLDRETKREVKDRVRV